MRAIRTLVPAAALAAMLAVSASADAATLVSIGLSNNGGPIVTAGTDPANAAIINYNLVGSPWTLNTVSGNLGFDPDILNGTAFNVDSTGAGVLDLYVTATGLTKPVPGFISGFTQNLLSAGWTVTETTYVSNTNALWTGTALASQSFSQIGSGSVSTTLPTSGTYSVTEQFHIVANGVGNAQSTIDVMAVPEPSAWALMLTGFFGMGGLLRRRRPAAAIA